ncbi:MAG: hypothetical protein CMD88_02090 [Gammaproteobacteria bacterium]|nr:hypothetical protein [Gammaproteobacteria bacterium]
MIDNKIQIGPIDTIFLLGGGKIVSELIQRINDDMSKTIKVISSPRHLKEIHNDQSFADFLSKKNINYLSIESMNDSKLKNFIKHNDNNFYLSIGAAWIFKKQHIDGLFHNKLLNLHSTRLPQNRGGGGFSWQILTKNRFGFCTIHMVDEGIDTGDIVFCNEFLYPAHCRIPSDYEKFYIPNNVNSIMKFISLHEKKSNTIKLIKQTEYFSSYWPRLNTDLNSWIDWSIDYNHLETFICAFDDPYLGAKTYLNHKPVYLKKCMVNNQDGIFHSYQSGIIYRKTDKWLCVSANGGGIIIEEVTNEKGESILEDIVVGDRFVTPHEKINESKLRVKYTSTGIK